MKNRILCAPFLVLIFFLVWLSWPITESDQPQTQTFTDRHGEVLFSEKISAENQIDHETPIVSRLIAIEDQNFYQHRGIDWPAISRAAWQNFSAEKIVSGGSTLSMQLARLRWLENENRTWWYKLKQIILARKLEFQLSKSEILTEYLESIPFGHNTNGLETAAERYFGKSAENLSLGEQAMLIGIIPNPANWNPITDIEKATERRNHVLSQLKNKGLISESESQTWHQNPLIIPPKKNPEITAPHFVFWAQRKMKQANREFSSFAKVSDGTRGKSQTIRTTLDANIYRKSLQIVRGEIERYGEASNFKNAGVVIIDLQDNSLVTMLGSPNFFDNSIDGSVNLATSRRQTGSVLKPFLFATALELGRSPADELIDEFLGFDTTEGRYNPRNFNVDDQYGRVRWREALANSYNLSAVFLLEKVGLDPFLKTLARLDLNVGNAENLGLGAILGSGEASLLQLTKAFGVFANRGERKPLRTIALPDEKLEDKKNPRARIEALAKVRIFSQSTADWVTDVLSDESARWRTFGRGNALEVGFPVAVKTGTSQSFRDNWVIGYSTRYLVGVWVGNANGSPLHTSSGVRGAGPIWNRIMRQLHEKKSAENFPQSKTRSTREICRRPYQKYPKCKETVQSFLTNSEFYQMKPTDKPKLKISFPQDGDIIHTGSNLLIKTLYENSDAETKIFIDGVVTSNPVKNFPAGSHQISAENSGVRSSEITLIGG